MNMQDFSRGDQLQGKHGAILFPISLEPSLASNPIEKDFWRMEYSSIISKQGNLGWTGVYFVFMFNITIFLIALVIFIACGRSGRHSIYWTGSNSPKMRPLSPSLRIKYDQHGSKWCSFRIFTYWKRFEHFVMSRMTVNDLYNQVGDEGTFYLLYQIYMIRLLVFMSIICLGVLVPVYYSTGQLSINHFESLTIRTIPAKSPMLWIPIATCWIFSIAFMYFIKELNSLYTYKKSNNEKESSTAFMKPSGLSLRSIFVKHGIPKRFGERKLMDSLEEIFPGYVTNVIVVLNTSEFKSYLKKRRSKEAALMRLKAIHHLKEMGSLPLCLRVCPGGPTFPVPCQGCLQTPLEEKEEKLATEISALSNAEAAAWRRLKTSTSNIGTGRAFIIFKNCRCRAGFVRRIRNVSLSSLLSRFPERSRDKVKNQLKKLEIKKWQVVPSPEPDDIDWDSVTLPFVRRTMCMIFINLLIVLLLVVFTSPVAVAAALSTGKYEAPDVISGIINEADKWLSILSPAVADMLIAYAPTLILVTINWILMTALYHAGRLQPTYTDSGKEQEILRSSTVYLIFNTLFVPSFAFVSIDALITHLQHNGQILDVMGKLFLHNTGTFYVNYLIQQGFIGTAISLLRLSEGIQFAWFKSRAVTDSEHKKAVEAWPFFTGSQSAMQISVLAVVMCFSTVVPVMVPFGVLFITMQYFVDKYSLLYVRPKILGRGMIARTATHASLFCILIYQAAMVGYFLARGDSYQSGSVVILLMISYVITLWWYIQDKQAIYDNSVKSSTEDNGRTLLAYSESLEQYKEPVLRDANESGTVYGSL